MAKVSTYLNLPGTTEEAFNFYKKVFGTEFDGGGFMRMGDAPQEEGKPALTDTEKNMIVHVSLPTLGGHMLMGTDGLASQGHAPVMGNSVSINLEPDTRAEADRLFNALVEGGKTEMPMAEAFWGDYFGAVVDRFGINWMINTSAKE